MSSFDARLKPFASSCLFAVLLGATLLPGCSRRPTREPPKTYPVSGQIVQTGGRPVAGTMIQFDPNDIELRSRGIIDADNKFKLELLFGNEQLDGAIEGKHNVTIYFQPDRIAANNGSATVTVDQPCEVRPGDNVFQIKLPPLK